ncbi:hypothetical protein OS188_09135 [Xanthomarina sp. F1114]|uniref:DUF4350 domain-containing protein n=1 Tax=Xanthomarina sp. F1114 TaxID=2996019 RepID=UPI00225E49B6|nr:DUF4350 domain-containing protein [Xanthomarina sp. F1114]MCX7548115.1 hypothetical protein [Xanthomarina sp. F1114]
MVLFSLISCSKTNWNENFKEKNKSPFGTYILFHEAEALFNNNEVHYLKENIYDYLFHHVKDDDFGNYICIKPTAYKLDKEGLSYLLDYVENGNNVFLSLNYFSEHLRDSLQFTTNNLDEHVYTPEDLKLLNGKLYLENKDFKNQPYLFDRNIRRNYFDSYNENNTIVLGTVEVNNQKQPNFIKIYYGKGAVFLHSNPVVFTNYNMLNGNEEYVENILSYLPSKDVLWDPQIKFSKYSNTPEEKQDSIFKFFLQHPSLSWFLAVSSIGLVLFLLFNSKRKQRAIPIIKPLQNSTVEFAQTISNVYLKEEDHKNLVDKKITYFLEKIREKYLIDTSNLNKEFIKTLALKSNNDLSSTKYLINTIIALNKKSECTDVELIVLNNMIEKFFKK